MQAYTPTEVLEEAATGVQRLSTLLRRKKTTLVRSKEEQQIVKATTLAWFNNYRASFVGYNQELFNAVEKEYTILFEYSSQTTSREKYLESLKMLRKALLTFQTYLLSSPSQKETRTIKPDFLSLIEDERMGHILENRWGEIIKCLDCNASLAATIMMGGFLEALFLARINKTDDKSLIFKAKSAPKDKQTGKTLPLNEWTLNSYIEVSAELGWITKPAKDIGVVLRDYRNFIHPERELSTGITLTSEDASMFWSIFVQLTQQILIKR